jgi:hypothetical protein
LFLTPLGFVAAGSLALAWFLRRQDRVTAVAPPPPRRTVPDSDWDW